MRKHLLQIKLFISFHRDMSLFRRNSVLYRDRLFSSQNLLNKIFYMYIKGVACLKYIYIIASFREDNSPLYGTSSVLLQK